MTALSSDLADALTAVCAALGDTLRTVRFEHDRIVFELASSRVIWVDPTGPSASLFDVVSPEVHHFADPGPAEVHMERLAIEVQNWCGEQLAQAVEDTDWTGRCRVCDGRGWVEGVDHAPECHTTGECVDCGGVPVQTACLACTGQPEGDDDEPF